MFQDLLTTLGVQNVQGVVVLLISLVAAWLTSKGAMFAPKLGDMAAEALDHYVTNPRMHAEALRLVKFAEERIEGGGAQKLAYVLKRLNEFAPWVPVQELDELAHAALTDARASFTSFSKREDMTSAITPLGGPESVSSPTSPDALMGSSQVPVAQSLGNAALPLGGV